MRIGLEILLLLTLFLIYRQDIKDRRVTLGLFVLGILLGGMLHFLHQNTYVFLTGLIINRTLILIIISVLYGYTKIRLKTGLDKVIGSGDILFFILLGVSFPVVSFVVLFVLSLIFSLLISIIFKKRFDRKAIPLAGLQSLFLGLSLIGNRIIPSLELFAL